MNRFIVVALTVVAPVASPAQEAPQAQKETAEEFEAKLGYQTGTVSIKNGLATIRLPNTFRFIGPEGSRRLLTEAWGNPKETAEGVLGMLIPSGVSPMSDEGWGIIITYDEDGYVEDKGAATINYDKLLKQLQDETREANPEREKQGFAPISVIGWAEPPSYDSVAHKLFWAKELAFGEDSSHTLNYNIRILGRRGVLVLNAVAGIHQLSAVHNEARSVLAAVEFNEGHQYSDYLPGKDKAATYGIVGLIAGAAAAKAGFFKVLWVAILGLKKVILVGLVAAGAAMKRFFGNKKAPEEPSASSST